MGIAPFMRPRSISRWAAGLGLAMVLGALGVSALAVWKLRQSATEAAGAQLNHVTLALSSHAAQTLASATLVLDGIAQSVADERIADADALRVRLGNESFHRMLRAGVAGAPAVEVAAIADDRGNVVNYSRVYPPKPINVMDREYFAVYSGPAPPPGAWVSAPVRNRTNGKWTFYIGRRIDAPGGRFLGLIVVGLTSEYFAQFYEALAEERCLPGRLAARGVVHRRGRVAQRAGHPARLCRAGAGAPPPRGRHAPHRSAASPGRIGEPREDRISRDDEP